MKPKTHFLTFVVEDYFHSSALSSLISPRRWQRFENRIEANTRRVMGVLDEFNTQATFFVLGCVADEMPRLVEEIAARGHEVASKGYNRQSLEELTPEEFREDVRRSKLSIERAVGQQVLGFRLGRGSLRLCDLWALDVLAEEGFRYDSSIYPQFRSMAKDPSRRFPHVHHHGDRQILELPLSSFGRDEWLLRVAGGNYLRQFPNAWVRQAFRYWHEHYLSPFNMYFHVWEFDPQVPRITGASMLSRIRQYRNLSKMPSLLRYFLENYPFGSIAEVMDLQPGEPLARLGDRPSGMAVATAPSPSCKDNLPSQQELPPENRPAVTVVVPCYNERPVLRYLASTLGELSETLGRSYELSYLFVDDGSTDGTANELEKVFAGRLDCRTIRHAQNQGVAAATLTGIRHADTEIVCVIDADCTYDPHQLQAFIPMLGDSVDLVTASPYHPLGGVMNVPHWRLFLSRGASRLYRLLLRNKLHTYTSCFRVYRKSAVQHVQVSDGRFLGITEILWQLDQHGSQILECPAVLEVRVLGASKLKTLRGILSHLKLLGRILAQRLRGPVERDSLSVSPPLTDTIESRNEVQHVDTRDNSHPPHATI